LASADVEGSFGGDWAAGGDVLGATPADRFGTGEVLEGREVDSEPGRIGPSGFFSTLDL
jgi:hypothetical protein